MTLAITHSTVATLPDEPGAEINKAEWNANHVVTGTIEQDQNNVAVDGVSITGDGTPGNPLVATAGAWGTITGTLSDQTDLQTELDGKQDVLTGLTASVAELNILDGATLTTTELNYVDGVTSAIQTQLDSKQATGNYITALTGDLTASGPGSAAATLATVNSDVGSFTNANITVNAKGLITAASNGSASGLSLEVNGTPNVDQTLLNLVEGTNMTITDNGDGSVTFDASGSGSSAFNDLTSGTNTTAAMVVGTGASLGTSGSGTIAATTATTATTATNVTVANEATDTTCFILFGTAATGDLGAKSNAGLTYNSNTNTVGTGPLVITSSSATALTVGPSGATNPALVVNANTGSMDCGLTVTGGTSGVTLATTGNDASASMTLTSKADGDFIAGTAGTSSNLRLRINSSDRFNMTNAAFILTPSTQNTASQARWSYTGAANTGLTGGAEFSQVNFNLSQTNQHASNTAITTQRDFLVSGMNHSYASATGTITNVGAFSVAWGNAGTNAIITHNAAIYIPTQAITGTVTNAYGARITAPSGATNNFAASLTGTTAFDGEMRIDGTPTTDDTANGPTTDTFNAGATIAQWQLVYMGSGGEWLEADASAASTSGPVMLALAAAAGTDNNSMKVVLPGGFARNDGWNWTVGAALYVSETTGAITETAPSTSGSIVRVIGYAMTADIVYFMPSGAWVEVA